MRNQALEAYPGNMVIMHMDADHEETSTHPKGNVYEQVEERLYTFPAGEPVEVPQMVGIRVMERKHFHGFVEVPTTKGKSGTTFDLESAQKQSLALLEQKDKEAVQQYVLDQMEDRVNKGLPALPPGKRLARIIRSRGISLVKQYNLHPINWEETIAEEKLKYQASEAVVAENKQLRRQVEELNDKFNTLLEKCDQLLTATPKDVQDGKELVEGSGGPITIAPSLKKKNKVSITASVDDEEQK